MGMMSLLLGNILLMKFSLTTYKNHLKSSCIGRDMVDVYGRWFVGGFGWVTGLEWVRVCMVLCLYTCAFIIYESITNKMVFNLKLYHNEEM